MYDVVFFHVTIVVWPIEVGFLVCAMILVLCVDFGESVKVYLGPSFSVWGFVLS